LKPEQLMIGYKVSSRRQGPEHSASGVIIQLQDGELRLVWPKASAEKARSCLQGLVISEGGRRPPFFLLSIRKAGTA